MNKLRSQISECMQDVSCEADSISAKFVFGSDFIGFQGHFPQRPILPGVCKIQAVIVMAERLYKAKVSLKEVAVAKFFNPVSPNQQLLFECRKVKEEGPEKLIKTLVTRNGQKIAKIDLKVVLEK